MTNDQLPTEKQLLPLPEPHFSNRIELMKEARTLAQRAWLESGQVSDLCLNPAGLAEFYGYTLYEDEFNPADLPPDSPLYANSSLVKAADSGLIEITLEKRDPIPRQRFSMAHEIGHLMWFREHMSKDEFRATPIRVWRHAANRPLDDEEYFRTNPHDYFADMFAHMFLIPNSTAARLADPELTIDFKLEAQRLKVSEETLRNRLYYYYLELANSSIATPPKDFASV